MFVLYSPGAYDRRFDLQAALIMLSNESSNRQSLESLSLYGLGWVRVDASLMKSSRGLYLINAQYGMIFLTKEIL